MICAGETPIELISKQVEKFSISHLCSSLKDIKPLYRCLAHLQQLLKTATNNFPFLHIHSGSWIRKILPCQLINWLKVTDARNATINWFYSTFYFENNHLMDKKCISSLLVSNFLIFALVEKVTLLSAAKNCRRTQQYLWHKLKKNANTIFPSTNNV